MKSEGTVCGRVSTTHLALATHSMVTSEVPATTLVFLGGMMMVGAMGSAGPPTSGERSGVGWGPTQRLTPWENFVLSWSGAGGYRAVPQTASEPNCQTLTPGTPSPLLLLCQEVSVCGEPTGDPHGLPHASGNPATSSSHPPSGSVPSKSFPPPARIFLPCFFFFHLSHPKADSLNCTE